LSPDEFGRIMQRARKLERFVRQTWDE